MTAATAFPTIPPHATLPGQRPRMPRWWMLLAPILGMAHAFSFAPFGNGWVQIGVLGAFALLLAAALDRRLPTSRLMLLGLLFGIGWFSAGVGWVYVSMHFHGGMPAPLAAAAVVLFAAYLGLYPALAAALTGAPGRNGKRTASGATAFILLFSGSFTLAELARGWVLTGFPWLSIGYAQTDTPLAGLAPVGGVYLVGLATTLAAAAIAQAIIRRQPRWLAVPALLLAAGYGLQQVQWSQPVGQPLNVSLLQGNVPQQLKFDPVFAAQTRDAYMRMIEDAPADLILLPETAWTMPWERTEIPLQRRMQAFLEKTGSTVALGLPRAILLSASTATDSQPHAAGNLIAHDSIQWTNSVLLLDARNSAPDQPRPVYDKQHLVPFGEFVPPGARWFIDLMNIPLGDMVRGAPDQPALSVRDQYIGFNICYEDLFGEELLRVLRPPEGPRQNAAHSGPRHHAAHATAAPRTTRSDGRVHAADDGSAPEAPGTITDGAAVTSDGGATILANVTNLGWFGQSHALPQHLQIARMRALETARPMIRATNTGISAIIDARGQVQAQLPIHQHGTLKGSVQGHTGLTPYARAGGNWLVLLASLLCMLAAGATRGAHRSPEKRNA